jgi:hypothetical protein
VDRYKIYPRYPFADMIKDRTGQLYYILALGEVYNPVGVPGGPWSREFIAFMKNFQKSKY